MPRVAKTFNAPGLTASGEVLQTLKAAYPHGVSTLELVKKHGVAVKSRIGDLRLDGWNISTGERGGVAYYSRQPHSRPPVAGACRVHYPVG